MKFQRVAVSLICVLSSVATANDFPAANSTVEEPSSTQKRMTDAKGRRLTVVTFDDAQIEGKAKAPDGFMLQSRSGGTFRNILELRKNFRTQIESSAQDGLQKGK